MNILREPPTYWLLQYAHNPVRQEPKNVGVFLHDGHFAHCRLLGESRGQLDALGECPRYFCRAFDLGEAEGWIFAEWANWFKTLAGKDRVSLKHIQAEFDRLNHGGNRFQATSPCVDFDLVDHDADSALDALYKSFVTTPTIPAVPPIERDFNDVLHRSELKFMASFHRDVEVEIGEGSDVSLVHFDAVLEEPAPLGIMVIQFQRVQEMTTITQVNNALYSFETSRSLGFLAPERCIVLHDAPPPGRIRHLDRLAKQAHLLPISDESTPRTLQQIALHPSQSHRSW